VIYVIIAAASAIAGIVFGGLIAARSKDKELAALRREKEKVYEDFLAERREKIKAAMAADSRDGIARRVLDGPGPS